MVFQGYASAFGGSISLRSPKDESEPLDYEFSINTHLDSLMLSELSYERQNGKYYRNVDVLVWKQYKNISVGGSYADIEEDSIKRISVDMRYVYSVFSIGIANVWNMKPAQDLVIGYKKTAKLGIPYFVPINLFIFSDTYTHDFKEVDNHTEVKLSAKISSIVSAYIKYKQRYYSKWNFQTKLGIEINI